MFQNEKEESWRGIDPAQLNIVRSIACSERSSSKDSYTLTALEIHADYHDTVSLLNTL